MGRQAQMGTSSRLLKIGESIEFSFRVPDWMAHSSLSIYPRYLETARPGKAFTPGEGLRWVEKLPKVSLDLQVKDGRAQVRYCPDATGSYLAKWTAGGETFYRYFSVIDDSYMVMAFSPFCPLEPKPTLHATGIPLDYRIPADKIRSGDEQFDRFLSHNRLHGDNIIPILPDTPTLDAETRTAQYGEVMSRLRSLMPDANEGRSAWIECQHELDPGYVATLEQIGVNDHCGLWCANAKPWLGMPEFPYFSSPIDGRKMNQSGAPKVVSHQWDFCGGWHFMGPVSWHFKVSEGDWSAARKCMLRGVAEFENLARMSGHPAFVNPLYEALDVGLGYPNPDFEIGTGEPRNFVGAVDEPFVCKRALTVDELQSVVANGVRTLKDPLAAWAFDEKDGPVVSDLSGGGFDGQIRHGGSRTPGRFGQAVLLDGKDDCITMESAPGIDTADFSIGCWVKPAKEQRPWANILSSHNAGGGAPFRGVSFEQESDTHNRFRLIAGNGVGWFTTDGVQLKPDEWQHLAAIRHGRLVTLYLNGKPVVENETPSDAPFPPATDGFRIGDWVRGTPKVDRMSQFQAFIDQYQRFIAFELPKKHHVAYARSIDVADYYRRHFRSTPRTIFASKTDHVTYDVWWTYQWDEARYFLMTRERLPWLTRVSKVPRIGYKDPLSYEFILVEDPRWSIRFERECPSPIWRFDYRVQERGPGGSAAKRTETPDVHIPRPKWERTGDEMILRLRLNSDTRFPDYAIAVWDLPKEIDESTVSASHTKDQIVVKNTDGERHLVLFFDLEQSMSIVIRARVKWQSIPPP